MALHQLTEDQRWRRRRSQAWGFLVATGFAVVATGFLVPAAWPGRVDTPTSLVARINPNTATAASLARLPGIGWTRAQAIIVHREHVDRARPGAVAFRSPEDLQRIPGIGPKTVQDLTPWLEFE